MFAIKYADFFCKCAKCKWMKEKEETFGNINIIKNLRPAEKQIFFFKTYKEAPITITIYGDFIENKINQELDALLDNNHFKHKFIARGQKTERLAIKSYLKKHKNVIYQLITKCHRPDNLKEYINFYTNTSQIGENKFYRFRNQYFCITNIMTKFVDEYV